MRTAAQLQQTRRGLQAAVFYRQPLSPGSSSIGKAQHQQQHQQAQGLKIVTSPATTLAYHVSGGPSDTALASVVGAAIKAEEQSSWRAGSVIVRALSHLRESLSSIFPRASTVAGAAGMHDDGPHLAWARALLDWRASQLELAWKRPVLLTELCGACSHAFGRFGGSLRWATANVDAPSTTHGAVCPSTLELTYIFLIPFSSFCATTRSGWRFTAQRSIATERVRARAGRIGQQSCGLGGDGDDCRGHAHAQAAHLLRAQH